MDYTPRMSRVIAIANQKGGVGKTTTTVNLSAALANMQKRVLLIDLDPQGNATMGCGIDKYDVEKSVFDVLVDGMSVAEASQASPENQCDVLPSNADLTAAEVELMSMDHREQRLKLALVNARPDYDYILIDCPPSLNILTLNAFVAADSVLVPVQCEYYALEGLSALLETIEGVRETVNSNLEIEGLLRTMYDGRNRLGVEVSGQLLQHFGDQVFRTVVPRNVRLAEAPSHGISIMQYDKTSRGALAYLALAGEILRQRARAEKAGPAVAPAIASTAIVEPNQSVSSDLDEDKLVVETIPTNDNSTQRDDSPHQPSIEESETPDTGSVDG
jgi:chromosome partitioning protein